jgi:hypothetical protein
MNKWRRAIVGREGSRGQMGDSTATSRVTSEVVLLNNYISNGKSFTTKDKHHGNSLVEFHLGAVQRFGEVEKIFESVETPGKTWFIIQLFKEVDKEQDPYRDYPDLNCQLVQAKNEVTEVISSERLIGHAAVLLNPALTFGYPEQTINAVGLRTAVSLFINVNIMC